MPKKLPVLPKDYNPGLMDRITPHFRARELWCPHCHVLPTKAFSDMLESLRVAFGKAINPSSVYRCEVHNKDVGGSRWSAHTYCNLYDEDNGPLGAIDIKIVRARKRDRFILLRAIYTLGFNMVEIADKHIHAAIVPKGHPMYMKHYSGFKSK